MSNQRVLTDKEMRYRMCLAGAVAGLASWFIGVWIPFLVTLPESGRPLTDLLSPGLVAGVLGALPQDDGWVFEVLDASLIGLFIGAFFGIFASRLWGEKLLTVQALLRLLIGVVGGGLAGALGVALSFRPRWLWLGEWPRAGILLAWCLTGAFVGLVIGLLKYKLLLRYVWLTLLGGLVGAAGGGALLLFGGAFIPHFRSVGLMGTGFAICLCATLAPHIARRATLKFVKSDNPTVDDLLRGQEWELWENMRYLFGRAESADQPGHQTFYVLIKDRSIWSRHALIQWIEGAWRLSAHDDNLDPQGTPLRKLEVGVPPAPVIGQHELQDGDVILMGQTRFLFLLRKKAAALLLCALAAPTTAYAQADTYRLNLPERLQLLRVQEGAETIAFRLPLNIVDAAGKAVKITAFNPAQIREGIKVTEGATSLKVCHVGLGSLPRRYTILLVDVSGSMLNPATKFAGMKAACGRFVEDFVPGVDYIAVIPFHSREVVSGVQSAQFFDDKEQLQKYIGAIPTPEPRNNTGLFSAVRAALTKLQEIQRQQGANAQYLLVVMTDGMNDVRAGDDKHLETTPNRVIAFKNEVGLPVITVGFGDDQKINETDLRSLAWAPPRKDKSSVVHYYHARRPEDLVDTFRQARNLQLDRLQVTFLPRPSLLSQLVAPHTYRIQVQLDQEHTAAGEITWRPGNVNVPQGVLTPAETGCLHAAQRRDWLLPIFIFAALFGLLLRAWFRPPRWISRSWEDEEIKLVWPPRISKLK